MHEHKQQYPVEEQGHAKDLTSHLYHTVCTMKYTFINSMARHGQYESLREWTRILALHISSGEHWWRGEWIPRIAARLPADLPLRNQSGCCAGSGGRGNYGKNLYMAFFYNDGPKRVRV